MAEMAEVPEHSWDFETDRDNPQPLVWPQCSDESCRTAYVWKRFMRISGGYMWAWAPDCKHDRRRPRPPAIPMTKDGQVPGGEAHAI